MSTPAQKLMEIQAPLPPEYRQMFADRMAVFHGQGSGTHAQNPSRTAQGWEQQVVTTGIQGSPQDGGQATRETRMTRSEIHIKLDEAIAHQHQFLEKMNEDGGQPTRKRAAPQSESWAAKMKQFREGNEEIRKKMDESIAHQRQIFEKLIGVHQAARDCDGEKNKDDEDEKEDDEDEEEEEEGEEEKKADQ